jgi:hypothetical protein
MKDRLRRRWQELVDEFDKAGVEAGDPRPLDPEWLETLRHVFVAGMVSYRSALLEAVDTPDSRDEDGDGEAIIEANLLDDELDALAQDLHEQFRMMVTRH